MTTQFVEMYHPLITSTITSPVLVPLQSADDHASNGWLLFDPAAEVPASSVPYLTQAALLSQISAGAAPVGTALRAAFGPFGFAVAKVVGNGTTDDGPVINSTLNAAAAAGIQRVLIPAGETGVVATGAKLVIPSGVTLEIGHGVELTRLASLPGNLIQNQAVDGTGRDANVGLVLGVASRINAGAPGPGSTGGFGQHHLRFRRCDGLTIRGAGPTSVLATTAGKFAISLGDVTNYTVENLGFSAFSDGCHVMGPAARGRIANLWGTSGDDFVAVTPNDWPTYNDTSGDVTDLTIENLYGTSTAACVLKLLGGGPTNALRRVTARNLFGAGNNNAIFLGDDTAHATTTGGLIDDVTVENIHSTAPNNQALIWINGSNIKTLRLHGVHFDNSAATVAAIRVAPPTVATIGTLAISDVHVTAIGAAPVIAVDANGRVTRLLVDRLTVSAAASGGSSIRIEGGVADLSLRGVIASLTSAYLLTLGSPAAAFVTRASLTGVHVVGTGGGLVTAVVAGQTLPNLDLAACTVNGTAWLFDLNTTTVINMSSVTHKAAGSGIANVRASGNLTFRGSSLDLASGNLQLAAGGAAHAYSLGFPCDVAKLARDNNGMAFNTNAALACGAGPVVSNGITWKHLHTDAIY